MVEVFSLMIAALALIYSIYNGSRTSRMDERLVTIEEKRREEELQRLSAAYVTTDVRGSEADGSYVVVVKNHGPGMAHDVRLVTSLQHRNEDDGGFLPKNAIRRYNFPRNWKTGEALARAHVEWKHPSGEIEQRHIDVP